MLKFISAFLIVATSFIMISCGGGETKKADKAAEPAESVAEEMPMVSEIEINSDDKMQYDKSELRVKAGTKVKLTLNHTGKMPKVAMGHNVVILKAGTDLLAFSQLAGKSQATGYVPESDAVIAHTDLIGGGESTTVEFDAPAKGEYPFICSFPGHYTVMKGTFIVE